MLFDDNIVFNTCVISIYMQFKMLTLIMCAHYTARASAILINSQDLSNQMIPYMILHKCVFDNHFLVKAW